LESYKGNGKPGNGKSGNEKPGNAWLIDLE
jgi:hypothetical protein